MEMNLLDAASTAFMLLIEPHRMGFLVLGVVIGLVLGIIPGIGGLAGTALLIPFTFGMDPVTAFAFLLGLGAVTATGDPIPAILFGVPGGAGSAATVLDGLPMARRGEAGRALSAAYMSSLMGGLFGAALLAVAIPILRPLMLFMGSPELLAFSIFGISMVAVLSSATPLRGLVAGCLGVMFALIGSDPQTGSMRWTMDTLYLWEGVPLLPLTLGLFALPELCDLAIGRKSISSAGVNLKGSRAMMIQGAVDCFENWWLVVRCSWLGAALGAVPGIGGAVIDWLAYGHASRTEKGASETFGKGDVRGVIASESANNAKEGGALVPTIAFGVPGSAGMAILLGAFMVHGLVPGPEMLSTNLPITYSMIWSVAIANILGAGLCYLFSPQFAKLATLRYTLILPCVLGIILIGAYEGSRSWGDLFALLFFGILGWTMKQMRWPRPPLILGFVLGDTIERYMFISISRYEFDWLTRPVVIVLFALALLGLMRPIIMGARQHGVGSVFTGRIGKPHFQLTQLFYVFMAGLLAVMLYQSQFWPSAAQIVPVVVGSTALLFTLVSLAGQIWKKQEVEGAVAPLHMDSTSEDDVDNRTRLTRAAGFFGWIVGFMISMALIGFIPTLPVFVILFMRIENREPWKLVLSQAIGLTLFVYVVFEQVLHMFWPTSLLGTWVPALQIIPSM